jgi:hypothetical protein
MRKLDLIAMHIVDTCPELKKGEQIGPPDGWPEMQQPVQKQNAGS